MHPESRRSASIRWAALGAIAIVACSPRALDPSLPAAPPRLLPRAEILAPPDFVEPKLSPDGRRLLAFARVAGDLRLCTVDAASGTRKPVFAESDPAIGKIDWAYDCKSVVFLSDQQGDENFHLLAVDVDQGVARDLTPIEGVKVDDFFLSPHHPGRVVVAWNARNPEQMDLASIDLANGASEKLAENPGDVTQWVLTPELAVAGCVAARPGGGGSVRAMRDGAIREEFEFALGDDVTVVDTDRAGTRFYLRSNVGSDTHALVELDLTADPPTPRVRCEDPGEAGSPWRVDLESAGFDRTNGTPLFAEFRRDRLRTIALDPTLVADLEFLASAHSGELRIEARDLANQHFVVSYSDDTAFPRYFSFTAGGRELRFLADGSTRGDERPHSRTWSLEIVARDGITLPAYLTLPHDGRTKNVPLVLLVHGGPWARDEFRYDPWVQLLANRGYAVLRVNFRGSVGFGKAFANRARKAFGREMQTDLLDAVNAMIERGIADPKRIAIMGASYGGYATLMGLATSPDLFACGVDLVGPSNLVTLVESFPADWKPFLARRWYPFVGDPSDPADRADMESRSPLFRVDAIRAPLLIAQGANDPRVKQAESDRMVEALRRAGKSVEYYVFPDEGHGLGNPANMLLFAGAVENFLAQHLGGRCEPQDPATTASIKR